MSTRSIIARSAGDGFVGRYHHSDGYPTGLGAYLFRLINRKYDGDESAFLRFAIDEHPAGWSHIYGAAPLSDKGYDNTKSEAQCYCHGYFAERDGDRAQDVTQDDNCGAEWAYAFDEVSHNMGVFAQVGTDIPDTVGMTIINLDGTRTKYPERTYAWVLRAVVPLAGPEPDWQRIECPDLTDCNHVEGYHDSAPDYGWVDKCLEGIA